MTLKRLAILGALIYFSGIYFSGGNGQGPLAVIRGKLATFGISLPTGQTVNAPFPERTTPTIRMASFNIQVFGEHKLADPWVMDVLVRTIRAFDIIAIQEIRSDRQDILPRFVELLNANGSHFDFAIGPRLGRTSSKEQYAYVFNAASIEIDRSSLYTVDDPDDLLHREPFVAGFRVRGVPPEQAFTFALVDVHTDPDEVGRELNVLDDVFRAVRNDGRNEDDIIMLGDFNADSAHLGELSQLPYLMCAIVGLPTNTRQTHGYDNLLFDSRATTEFTGRSGVFDLMREFNLSAEDALRVSDHFPVWGEFSLNEGGDPGRVATLPAAGQR